MVALIDSNPMLCTDSRLALSTAAGLALGPVGDGEPGLFRGDVDIECKSGNAKIEYKYVIVQPGSAGGQSTWETRIDNRDITVPREAAGMLLHVSSPPPPRRLASCRFAMTCEAGRASGSAPTVISTRLRSGARRR